MPRRAPIPSGRPYGSRQDLARAEAALPVPSPAAPSPTGAPAPAPGAQTGGGGLASAMADMSQMAPMAPMTGGNDQVMPNVARPISTMPPPQMQTPLNVVRFLPALEAAAAAPGSDWATRQMVRRLRAQLPPNVDMADPQLAGG